MRALDEQRSTSKKEIEHLEHLRSTVAVTHERIQMQKEDHDAWLMREKDKLAEERDLVH